MNKILSLIVAIALGSCKSPPREPEKLVEVIIIDSYKNEGFPDINPSWSLVETTSTKHRVRIGMYLGVEGATFTVKESLIKD